MRTLLLIMFALTVSAFTVQANAATYVVAVGIAKYLVSGHNLLLPEKDARTIAAIYKNSTDHVVTITGRQATRGNIIRVMTEQFARAKKGDMVVLFFSGHGYEGGFCPYDMRPPSNMLTYQDVYSVFRRCRATRKVVIADACKSGGIRNQSRARSKPKSKSDVVMFLSSRTGESSFEVPGMKNGYFTACLERGLRGGADANHDRVITAKEIFTYVSNGVKNLSKGQQHPVMWGNFDDNFVMMDWRK